MKWRVAGLSIFGSAIVLGLVIGLGAAETGAQTARAPRISFIIATGPTGGTYFPIGQAMAGIVSHPPGVDRCEAKSACGPVGLIASARTSAGSVANVMDIDARRADSGLAQSDVVAEAMAGTGPFRKTGALKHLSVIASLFPEEVHVVAARAAHIRTIADLRGKRVLLGDVNSGTAVTAHAVLAAWRVSEHRIKEKYLPSDEAADALDRGKLDAFFFVGGAPVGLIADLVARGRAVLVPLDGAGRARLLAAVPGLSTDTIAAGTYPNAPATQTVSTHALWVVNDAVSGDVVYGVVRALFSPANRNWLDQSHPSARLIRLDGATANLPAPLHPGAARFYNETRRILGKRPDRT